VQLFDENLLQGPPPHRPLPEVVGITVHLTFARRAYALARWYRERGATVVLGGLHVTSCPEQAAPHADALAIGEGTQIWPQILADVRAGRLRARYIGSYATGYEQAPAPRRQLLPRARFLTTSSIIATRGCRNRCGFCYLSTRGLRMPYRLRRVGQVVDEIRADGQPYVVFTDNNLGCRRQYLRELCRRLEPLRIIWSAAVSLDVTDEPSLVRAMARSGCTGVFVGLETLSDDNLRDAGKNTPRVGEYARRVAIFHDHGIQVNASFVFGFDHDRGDVFERTTSFIEAERLQCATFHILTPYPGTPLFARLQAEHRLIHQDFDRYDTAHAVFRPRHMSPAELERGYVWSYRRLFSHGSIWRRRPRELAAVPPYLAMAYLYKRANPLWHLLIRAGLTHAAWRPLVEVTRWRHLRYRERWAADRERACWPESGSVSASVATPAPEAGVSVATALAVEPTPGLAWPQLLARWSSRAVASSSANRQSSLPLRQ